MNTEFVRDRDLADPDQSIDEAAAERPRKPILVRVQPAIYRLNDRGNGSGNYRAWKDVHWTITLTDREEGRSLRAVLQVFFTALGSLGPEMVIDALEAAQIIAKQRATQAAAEAAAQKEKDRAERAQRRAAG